MNNSRSALYDGVVVHRRLRPIRHELRYRVFSLLVDCAEIPALSRKLRLLSYNRFNLFSLHDSDHGDGTPLRTICADRASERLRGRRALPDARLSARARLRLQSDHGLFRT
jgi:uncharacterized protein